MQADILRTTYEENVNLLTKSELFVKNVYWRYAFMYTNVFTSHRLLAERRWIYVKNEAVSQGNKLHVEMRATINCLSGKRDIICAD
jgi:hypothetical protein